jgi:3-oxoacyl-[acyl-carrier protein] reductase
MKHSDKVVLVTGATRGLGFLISKKFWDVGADLILVARNSDNLRKTVESLKKDTSYGQKSFCFPFDLSDTDRVPGLIRDITDQAGEPDIVVNNAGIQGPIGPLCENDWKEWQTCLNVNLLAPIQISRAFLPAMMRKKSGRIINISGGGATSPRPFFSSYATAKCGLVRFSETLAHEVAPYGITVNCISPGAMSSDLTRKIIAAGEEYAGATEYEIATRLIQENPHTENLASDLVLFLCSDQCSNITGKLISAVWDPWEKLPEYSKNIMENDIFTLRRILPEDRDLTIR